MELQGKRIAIVIATGFHEHELLFPYYRFKEAGAEVIVAGPEAGATLYGEGRHGTDGLPFVTGAAIADLQAEYLDAVHLPGGIYGPLSLRTNQAAVRLIRDMVGPKWDGRGHLSRAVDSDFRRRREGPPYCVPG